MTHLGLREPLPELVSKLFRLIEAKREEYIAELAEIVAYQTVSGNPQKWGEIVKLLDWFERRLKKMGAKTEMLENTTRKFGGGQRAKCPPVLMAFFGNDRKKKTLTVYGHVDVYPADQEGWTSDPFTLLRNNGKLYGRGSSDNKGPVLCWLHAVEAYQYLHIPLPINLQFLFEGLQEQGSLGLEKLMFEKRKLIFNATDYVCITDSYWLGTKKPCIIYGLRGICCFNLEVCGGKQDVHSGFYGGAIHEPMSDLFFVLSKLVNHKAGVTIPGIMEDVARLTPEEEMIYKTIDCDLVEMRVNIGANRLAHNEDKVRVLMHRWRYPSLTVHGINGAFQDPFLRTIIPHSVVAKFSIRIVEHQTADRVFKCVENYIKKLWSTRKTPNKVKLTMGSQKKPWVEDPNSPVYKAARQALRNTYRVDPDVIRQGGGMKIASALKADSQKPVVLLAIGAADDNAHGVNEKINEKAYIEGHKLMASFIHEVGLMKVMKKK